MAAPLAEFHVAAHRQVGEQPGFLEDDAEGAAVGRQEMAACLVLPHRLVQREVTAGCPLQAGHGAQQGGLARAGVAEQRSDALAGQFEVDIEGECTALDAKAGLDRLAHRVFRLAGLKVYSAISTMKLNSTMPPDSQWAWVYSSASTWS